MWRVSKSGALGLFALACVAAAACSEGRAPSQVVMSGGAGAPVLIPPGSAGSILFPTAGRNSDDLSVCAQDPPLTPLTRWSTLDLDGTLDDLFGPGTTLASTARVGDRRYWRDISVDFVSALRSVALERVQNAVADSDTFEVCADDEADDSCIQLWLREWGEKLYRRPLSPEQLEAYVSQFQGAQPELTPAEAARNSLISMILSPYFALRLELGDVVTGQLTSYEVAARVSHFATRRSPDAELRQSAASGAILDRAERLAQVRRLWKLEAGQAARAQQHLDWLELNEQRLLMPLEPELRAEVFEQSKLFINDLFDSAEPTLAAFLTSALQPLNASLAAHYGLPAPEGDGFSFVATEPELATGILSQGLFLSTYARPTMRGLAIFRGLLCGNLPDHPPMVPYDYADGATPRERITQGIAGRSECRACHDMVDPFGFALEAFDEQGRRTGFASDGSIRATSVGVTFQANNPGELGQGLALHPVTVSCAARHYVEYALDRDLSPSIALGISAAGDGPPPIPIIRDEPEKRWIDCLAQQGQSGRFNLQQAMESLVQSTAFTARSTPARHVVAFDTSVNPLDHAAAEASIFVGVFGQGQDNDTMRNYANALLELKRLDALGPATGAGGAAGAGGANDAGSAGHDSAGGNGASGAP